MSILVSSNENWRHFLCFLEPINDVAEKILVHNRQTQDRVTALYTEHGVLSEMLGIHLTGGKQQRGLAMFGRGPGNTVQCPSRQFSLDHCYIGVNPRTGIPVIYNLSRHETTYLDDKPITLASPQVMMPERARKLRLNNASFQIHWPKVPSHELVERESLLLKTAMEIQGNEEAFDLTDSDPNSSPSQTNRTITSVNANPEDSPERVRKLGKGGFGSVWQAIDVHTGDYIAVKRITKTSASLRIMREVEFMKDLDHPNILSLLSWHDTPTHLDLHLEYLPLGDLAHNRHLARPNIKTVFTDMATALSYLHAGGLIHRDIKPANILIDQIPSQEGSDYRFKLADFGLSNWDDQAITLCGTPGYLAPEIIARAPQTTRVDIYSLGVVLLELLGFLEDLPALEHKSALGEIHEFVRDVVRGLGEGENGGDIGFVGAMVETDPVERPTAEDCLKFLNSADGRIADGMMELGG